MTELVNDWSASVPLAILPKGKEKFSRFALTASETLALQSF